MHKLMMGFICSLAMVFASAAVNLNTATQAELEGLKGVGPSKAKAIVDFRQKNGAFKTVDDLDKVPGFGKATLDKLRPELTVAGGAASKPAAKPVSEKKK